MPTNSPNPNKPPVAKRTIRKPDGTVIRKGTRKPYRKATNLQIEERVEELAAYYRRHPLASRFQLHKQFVGPGKWDVHWAHFDQVYIFRARKLNRKLAEIPRAEAKAVGNAVIADLLDHDDPKVRVAAEKAYRDIHGYGAPTHVRVGNPDGSPQAPAVVAPTVIFQLPDNHRNGDKQ